MLICSNVYRSKPPPGRLNDRLAGTQMIKNRDSYVPKVSVKASKNTKKEEQRND